MFRNPAGEMQGSAEGLPAMICVTTRFHLKHCWQLVPIYLAYKRMQQDLKATPGLIRYAFLLQNPITCYTFSIWESEKALVTFSNISSHLSALRRAKAQCRGIWSTYWHFDRISTHAQYWPGSIIWPYE